VTSAGHRLGVARIAAAKGGGRELRVGFLLLPEQAPLTSLYPSLELAGESDELAQTKLEQIRADLAAVTQAPPATAAVGLVAFVDKYAEWLERSEAVRQAVRSADAKLVPVLGKLGEAKVSAMRGNRDTGGQRGLAGRARTRALADVSAAGGVQLGANTRAFWLDTSKLWPRRRRRTSVRSLRSSARSRTVPSLPPRRWRASSCAPRSRRPRVEQPCATGSTRSRRCSRACSTVATRHAGRSWWSAGYALGPRPSPRAKSSICRSGPRQSALDAPMAVEAGCAKR